MAIRYTGKSKRKKHEKKVAVGPCRISEATMKISNNTILITGGTSGIGFELATRPLALGNTVIITGRDQLKLDRLKREYPLLHTIQSDVNDPRAIASLTSA